MAAIMAEVERMAEFESDELVWVRMNEWEFSEWIWEKITSFESKMVSESKMAEFKMEKKMVAIIKLIRWN